ncbi:MAG TPA: PAS domain S-box protein, partial [Usitatibacter sp.]|nr:PAS domain S-box protein [Usitatibacter sp.]
MSAVAREPSRLDFDLLQEAFERTGVGLALLAPDGVFLKVNAAFCEMTAFSRAELEGHSFRRIVHPDEIARDEDYLAAVRGGAELSRTVEKRYVRRDGTEFWGRCSTTVARDASGERVFVVAAFFDITEAHRKDLTLRQTNSFLAAVVENSPVAIYTTDLEGRVNLWNPAAERIFGYKREQALGHLAPFIPPERREEARRLRERVLAGETLAGLELERRRADGSTIFINGSAAPLRDEADRVTGLLVACIDVSDARQTARELEQHLHFTRALLDAIPSPVYFKDREGRYRVYNRAWDELFGRGEDWKGRTVNEMFDERLAAEHNDRDRMLIERPASTTYEARVPTAEGEMRQLLYNKVSFVDRAGEVAGLIGVITDVTRYKETEHALEA